MSTKAPKKTSVETWKERYDLAVSGQESMFEKFASWYDLMYAHINTSQYALWRSKVFIPIIPSKAWSMIAKFQSLQPGFEVSLYGDALNDENAQENAEKAQWKLEHDWDNPEFDDMMSDKLFSPLVDAVVTGTGIAKVPWCFGDSVRYEKHTDETGEIDLTQDVKITNGHGYNDLIPHDIMATYIAPGAKNGYSAEWIILEDWVTFNQLERENEASGGVLYDKDALAKAKDMKSSTDRFASEKRSRTQIVSEEDTLTTDTTVSQIKRLECYEKSSGNISTIVVGDSGDGEESFLELKCKANPYWHGKYPLVFFYVKRRPHTFWGQGVFEDTERLQSAFNDLFNHYMDNLNLSLDGMIMKQEGESYEYVVEPGGEFLYKNNKPEQFKFPEPNATQFNTIMQFMESQVEDATVSQYATGTPNSATDKTAGTASGIMRLQEAAGDKIAFMRKNFGNALREIGRQWLSNNQQFLDRPFTLMGQENNLPAPVTIQPQDLQGQLVLRINDASMEPQSKDQQLAQFNAYADKMMQFAGASQAQAQATGGAAQPFYLDYTSLAQDFSLKLGRADFDKIIVTQEDVVKKQEEMQQQVAQQDEQAFSQDAQSFGQLNGGQMDGQPEAPAAPAISGAGGPV